MPRPSLLVTLLVAALATRPPAQAAGAPTTLGQSTGLSVSADGLVAGGAGWEARFDRRGVTFVPALGRAAPEEQTLRFEVVAIERGGARVAQGAAAPTVDGATAVYARAPGVEERYEVRPDGLAQSFVLVGPVGEDGDLVIRSHLLGTLPRTPERESDGALVFRGPHGGVRIGALTGIDARGVRAAGEVRQRGNELELVLPAPFVRDAAWPLLVDPLLGPVFAVEGSTFDDAAPDAAWDASSGAFLAVWTRTFSSTSSAVRGQQLDGAGALIGGTIFFSSSGTVIGRPHVADANHGSRFAVSWVQSTVSPASHQVRVQLCTPVSGALSNAVLVASGASGTLGGHDIGGEVQKNSYNQVMVVWDRSGTGIQGATLAVEATGEPVAGPTFLIAGDVLGLSSNDAPAISRTAGGNAGVYAVAWLRRTTLFGDFDPYVILLGRDGAPLSAATRLFDTPSVLSRDTDHGSPAHPGEAASDPHDSPKPPFLGPERSSATTLPVT